MATISLESAQTYVDNIRYFTCQKGCLHEGEALNRICTDKKCSEKGLICVICEEETHKHHQTIPVKQFLRVLINQNKRKFDNSIESLLTIEKLRLSIEKVISLRKRQVQQQFQNIQNEARRYFDEIETIAKNLFHVEGPIQKVVEDMIYGTDENLPSLTKRISEVLDVTSISLDNQFSIKKILSHIVQNVNEKYDKTVSSLTTLMATFTKSVQSITAMLEEPFNVPEAGDYNWSTTMKGAKIMINGNIAEQTGMEAAGQRFILMNKNLNTNTRKKAWGIKIKKFGGWIGIGISLKKQIATANYNFHYTVLGHGSYLISTNGYSWSHSEKEFNSAFKCFTFSVGDTVYMEYNPHTRKLKFRKNQSIIDKDTFELDVVAPPGDDVYHPCANLCGTNDIVEIVPCTKALS